MTDISELVQKIKAAANKAKQANELYLEGKITLSECVVETKEYLDYSDNPDNILALTAVLEKAQARIAELEARTVRLPEHFYPDGDIDYPLALNEHEVIEALAAVGVAAIKWESES